MITPELAAFLESGVSVLVGTRDARLVSECQRALGVRVEPDGQHFVVFVPRAVGERIVELVRRGDREHAVEALEHRALPRRLDEHGKGREGDRVGGGGGIEDGL